jgi:hypothetical protein
MDLALELGSTEERLARLMSEREFRRWQKYAAKRLLPTRRLEFYLAQIAQLIAITMGGVKDAKLSDYLIEPAPVAVHEDAEVVDIAALRKAFGFKPRKGK